MTLPSQSTQTIVRQYPRGQTQIWSEAVDDVISDVVPGGSSVMRWIPSRPVQPSGDNTWYVTGAHFSGIWGKDFNGSQTYLDYITENGTVVENPAECEFGGGGMDYQAYEYQHELQRVTFSNEDDPITFFHSGGVVNHKNQSGLPRIRGELLGVPVTDDVQFNLAMLGRSMHDFMDWNIWNGDSAVPTIYGGYDGLNTILSTNWINNHIVGDEEAPFSDPTIVNGAGITTIEALLKRIKHQFYVIYNRARARGYLLTPNDVAIHMGPSHWRKLASAIAVGILKYNYTTSDIAINTTPEVIQRTYYEITNYNDEFTGGMPGAPVYAGYIPLDNFKLPVIVDEALEVNSTIPGSGNPAVTGDMYILTRYFRGQNILEHLYLDWNRIPWAVNPPTGPKPVIMQNGMIRAKWLNLKNDECWYWGIDMYAMLMTYMQPLQCKILDVTLEMDFENTVEAGLWTHPDYYMYEGAKGGQGNTLLYPSN